MRLICSVVERRNQSDNGKEEEEADDDDDDDSLGSDPFTVWIMHCALTIATIALDTFAETHLCSKAEEEEPAEDPWATQKWSTSLPTSETCEMLAVSELHNQRPRRMILQS